MKSCKNKDQFNTFLNPNQSSTFVKLLEVLYSMTCKIVLLILIKVRLYIEASACKIHNHPVVWSGHSIDLATPPLLHPCT